MRKITIIIISIVLFTFNSKGQKHNYQDKENNCMYETTQGRLDGQYVSYYKNGIKKAEGKYDNNCRIGIWTVWDTTGKIRMQRAYENLFNYKNIFPTTLNDTTVESLNTPKYTLQYNKDGYIESFFIKEKMVVWSSRIWRIMTSKDNPLLFENNTFINIINKNAQNKNITTYNSEDFTRVNMVNEYDTSSLKVIRYKLKEETFFDNQRQVSESRILGICPVAINTQNNDTLDLYWIYFPDFRKVIAKEQLQQNNIPIKIKTFDDLFFFRYFYGQIYKESNVYNRPISKYKSGIEIDKEAERIEMGLINTEHDYWLSLTKQKKD